MKQKEIYQNNTSLAIVFLLISYFSSFQFLVWISICILVVTNFSIKSGYIIFIVTSRIFHYVGNLNGKIILLIFYFFILTPISLIYHLFNKEKNVFSNWKNNEKKEFLFKNMW
jgi:hypothetical protein